MSASSCVQCCFSERLIENLGYDAAVHTIPTPDGYLLTVHRISGAKQKSPRDRPPHNTPVLVSAGLASNSEMWVLREPNLATSLVNAGFDVWLTNFRGNSYGLRHETLHPKRHEFWDFSWHENGLIDQASTIDYVLETTGRNKLITIGHSMGSTAQVVLLSEKPSYAEKVLCSVFLAPPIYFSKPPVLPTALRNLFYLLPQLKESTGRNVVNDKMPFMDQCMAAYCFQTANEKFNNLCRAGISAMLGKPQKRISDVNALKLLAHFPGGGSIRQVLHYGQSIASGGFQKYDFGSVKNLKLYGSPHPPSYNLSAITTPIYVYYGTSDGLVSSEDVRKFTKQCPAVKEVHALPYNHLDYALADDINEAYIKPVIGTLMKYI
ncbi:lipase 1-like isoform X2 [Thrips palmi]|uniref:Lipase n=1 Tax=Thrips palmi TaxID=161013 RepID=A0A6P9ABT8_THRPL|nr:lipase 1-like isoform X2 [Thrips palmi]